MRAMLPGGFEIRAPTLGDLEEVVELVRACEAVDDGAAESTVDDVRTDWALPGVDLGKDVWVVTNDAATIVGYASLWQRVKGSRYESDGYTHPDFRGRGIGTVLVREVEARAREQAFSGAKLITPINHSNETARGLLENEGYSPARYYWRMMIDIEEEPAAPEWPAGVSLRTFEAGRDDATVHALIQETFADNHDYAPLPLDAWRREMIERASFDPSLFLLAESGEETVGAALCPRYEGLGWVRQLAVRREERGRGIGMSLLQAAFGEFWRRGERRVGLVVNSFNRTGAKKLYERAGMRVERQHDGYEKEVGG